MFENHPKESKIESKNLRKITQNGSFLFLNFGIFHTFLAFKIDLSGHTVWLQASDFPKLVKMDFFCNFQTQCLHCEYWMYLLSLLRRYHQYFRKQESIQVSTKYAYITDYQYNGRDARVGLSLMASVAALLDL